MEEVVYLFNADYEKKLIQNEFNKLESSKINQEFEYLIHWLHPEYFIYTQKKYDQGYRDYLFSKTNHKLKTTITPKSEVHLFCQDFNDLDVKMKLNNKFETMSFLMRQKLINYPSEFVTNESELKENHLYKSPYGMSGSGHFIYPRDLSKIRKTLTQYKKVLGEPILKRSRDFSSLFDNGTQLATYENYIDDRFQYRGSYFSPHKILSEENSEVYNQFISDLEDYTKGYHGVMSVDGFLYNEGLGINPCCEINCRKTMGFIAFSLWKKYFGECPFFKFLLFKNNFSTAHLETFHQAEEGGVLLLSPKTNQFLTFCIAAENEVEVITKEKKLVSTLFNSF